MRTEIGQAPLPGQVTLCSITGSDRRAADSSLDPYSQTSHLKHIHKVIIFRNLRKGPENGGLKYGRMSNG